MPVKVFELAEQYQIEPKALLSHLKELGIFVSSHMSQLDDDEVKRVEATIGHLQKRPQVMEERVRPTVIRRRTVRPPKEEQAEEEAKQPEEEQPSPPSEQVKVEEDVQRKEVVSVSEEAAPSEEEEEVDQGLGVEEETTHRPAREKARFEAAKIIRRPRVPTEEQPKELKPEQQASEKEQVTAAADLSVPEVTAEAKRTEAERKRAKPSKEAKKKAKEAKEGMEPAKIIGHTKPELVQKYTSKVAPPPPGPVELEVPIPPKPEPPKKAKKRKALKSFEVIQEERPVKGRGGKKREVIQLRDELEEPERLFKVIPRRKKAKEVKKPEITVPKAIKRKIRIAESISVGELARRMGIKSAEVIKRLMQMGVMATVNQTLDPDEAALVAGEFGYEVERVVSRAEEILEEVEAQQTQQEENLVPRPPVVTVMGHVDHGKTSLLDAIRQSRVTDQEVGGITQHIGAYQVEVDGQKITFLDTPGHEAFTSLRARGAQVTDIVVLVVAADDGVMNQTREAIDHARAAEVPIIVAINKIDKPNAEPDRVKQELANVGLIPEQWGGDTLFCEVSAKKNIGIQELLEAILLQAEMLELKANPDKLARGTVIEAKLDRHRGPVATILVQEGTLRRHDPFVAGAYAGRVRMMMDHLGRPLEEAGPATPVEVVGASGVPQPGERFIALSDEKEARDIEAYRQEQLRREEISRSSRVSLDRLMEQMEAGEVKELPVVIKGDVQGSVETLRETLQRTGGEKVKIQVIHASVGAITENDVNLASASNAIIIGFNVRPEPRAQGLAEEMGVDIRTYDVIYELLEDIEKALKGMLEPTRKERVIGRGEVVQTFRIAHVGTIAGTLVKEGKMVKAERARLIRDGVVVYDGRIDSLRRYQEDYKEVPEGQDCGIHLENFNDVKVADIIEAYEMEEVEPEL